MDDIIRLGHTCTGIYPEKFRLVGRQVKRVPRVKYKGVIYVGDDEWRVVEGERRYYKSSLDPSRIDAREVELIEDRSGQ